MKELRVIIAGGRDFNDYFVLSAQVIKIFADLIHRRKEIGIGNDKGVKIDNVKIVSGTARGADKLGEKFAESNGLEVVRFPADWKNLGKRAGYVRNTEMAKYSVADGNYGVLIAFWDGKSRGTKHMIDLANKYGLEIHVVNYGEEINEKT